MNIIGVMYCAYCTLQGIYNHLGGLRVLLLFFVAQKTKVRILFAPVPLISPA